MSVCAKSFTSLAVSPACGRGWPAGWGVSGSQAGEGGQGGVWGDGVGRALRWKDGLWGRAREEGAIVCALSEERRKQHRGTNAMFSADRKLLLLLLLSSPCRMTTPSPPHTQPRPCLQRERLGSI